MTGAAIETIVEAVARRTDVDARQRVVLLRDAIHPDTPPSPPLACDPLDAALILRAVSLAVFDPHLRPSSQQLLLALAWRYVPGRIWHGDLIALAREIGIGAHSTSGRTARLARQHLVEQDHISPMRERGGRRRTGWIIRVVEHGLPAARRATPDGPQYRLPLIALAHTPPQVLDAINQPAPAARDVPPGRPRGTGRAAPAARDVPDRPPEPAPAARDVPDRPPEPAPAARDVPDRPPEPAPAARDVPDRPPEPAPAARDVPPGPAPSSTHARDPDPDPDPDGDDGVVDDGVEGAGAGARLRGRPATDRQREEVARLCLRRGAILGCDPPITEAEAMGHATEVCTSRAAASAAIDGYREEVREWESLSRDERRARRRAARMRR